MAFDKKEKVRQKVLARLKNYKLRMPLVNPETLFSSGVWVDAFRFIHTYLKEAGKRKGYQPFDELNVEIRDLYFAKVYDKDFDFKKAKKNFSDIFETKNGMT